MNGNTRDVLRKLRSVLDSDQGGLGELGRMGLTAGIAGLAGNMVGGPLGIIIGGAASAILSPNSRSKTGALTDLLENNLTHEQKNSLARLLQSTLGAGVQSGDTRAHVLRIILGFLKELARNQGGRHSSCC